MFGHEKQDKLAHLLPLERRLHEYEPALQDGVRELLKAYELAVDASRDRWEFAVELQLLQRLGLTESDLRWLICKGIVEHGREITAKGDAKRKFRPAKSLKFNDSACFVLTREFAQTVTAHGCMVVAGPAEQCARDPSTLTPQWKSGRRELHVADFLVKRFRWPARNQETLLAAFAEERWAVEGIDDPLPPHPDHDPKQRLRDTIKCLNRNQEHRLIRFRSDGTGERVIWQFTPQAIEIFGVASAMTRRRA
jgi:hypothetical protein